MDDKKIIKQLNALNGVSVNNKERGYYLQSDGERFSQKMELAEQLPRVHFISLYPGDVTDFTDADLELLRKTPELRELRISSQAKKYTGNGLAVLKYLTKLESLDCSPKAKGDEGLAAIGRVTTLRVLRLQRAAITDKGLPSLSHLTELRELDLWRTSIAEGIRFVVQLPHLEKLNIALTNVGDDDMEAIGKVVTLKSLDMNRVKLTDKGLKHLAGLKNLKLLSFGGTPTAAGYEYIVDFPLEDLAIPRDHPVDAATFDILCRMKTLQRLWSFPNETKLTRADYARLQKALPSCQFMGAITDEDFAR